MIIATGARRVSAILFKSLNERERNMLTRPSSFLCAYDVQIFQGRICGIFARSIIALILADPTIDFSLVERSLENSFDAQ